MVDSKLFTLTFTFTTAAHSTSPGSLVPKVCKLCMLNSRNCICSVNIVNIYYQCMTRPPVAPAYNDHAAWAARA